MTRPVRIANFSGFYGDRISAPKEMLDGGPIDFLTGDYLAELTLMILWKGRRKDPTAGYAKTFLVQMEQVLGEAMDRGVKIVTDAGGLNPAGLADRMRELAERLGIDAKIAHIEGDDLKDRLEDLQRDGLPLPHLDTGRPLSELDVEPMTANAYLGSWGVVEALDRGADVVICPRITDAVLAVAPAAWWHKWQRDDWDKLAAAVVAGHVIECGPQATGGNYPFYDELGDMRSPGFPIAEIAEDGATVITKHASHGGAVTVGTVTAQLLYEIAGPRYPNPDVVARFDTICLEQEGKDRVRIDGVRGEPSPPETKVCINYSGGFRNSMTFVMAGLDIDRKVKHDRRRVAGQARRRRSLRDLRREADRERRRGPGDERAGVQLLACDGQGPRPQQGRPRVLERLHRARARRLPRLLHDHAAAGRDRVHGVLADARAGGGDRRGRRRPRRLAHPDPPAARRQRAADRGSAEPRRQPAGRPDSTDRAGPRRRRALGRQGRQRQLRCVGAVRSRLRMAAAVPHRRSSARAAAGGARARRSTATSSRTCARSTSSSRAFSARA